MGAKRTRKSSLLRSEVEEPPVKRVKYEDAVDLFGEMEVLAGSLRDRPEQLVGAPAGLQTQLLALLQSLYLYGEEHRHSCVLF
jgi:hypothetical protein